MGKRETGARTEIVPADQIQDRVTLAISRLRYPEDLLKYEKELADYENLLRTYDETDILVDQGTYVEKRKSRGVRVPPEPAVAEYLKARGQSPHVQIERPRKPQRRAYYYFGHEKGLQKAHAGGLLTDSLYNRDIRPQLVDRYAEEMQAGRWRTVLSDPIAITSAGQVLNGQHRIAAVEEVDWSSVENIPSFLVIWGASSDEALYADRSRRTDREQTLITDKFLRAEEVGA
jgi:hypothetical protein